MGPRTSRLLSLFAVVAVLGAAAPAQVAAQDDEAPPTVTYRQAIMQGLRHSTGALRAVMGDQVPYTDHVLLHASMINSLAQMVGDVFPAGSGHAESRALPAIWEDSALFAEKVSVIQSAASDLLAAAEAQDMDGVGEALRGVGGSCRGCHTDFRAR